MPHSRQPLQFKLLNLQRPSLNDLVMTPGVFKVQGLLINPLTLELVHIYQNGSFPRLSICGTTALIIKLWQNVI